MDAEEYNFQPAPVLGHTQWLSPQRVCWVLDIKERTLREWQRKRLIPFVKLGRKIVRYDPAAVFAFLMQRLHVQKQRVLSFPAGEGDEEARANWACVERLIQAAAHDVLVGKEAA